MMTGGFLWLGWNEFHHRGMMWGALLCRPPSRKQGGHWGWFHTQCWRDGLRFMLWMVGVTYGDSNWLKLTEKSAAIAFIMRLKISVEKRRLRFVTRDDIYGKTKENCLEFSASCDCVHYLLHEITRYPDTETSNSGCWRFVFFCFVDLPASGLRYSYEYEVVL